MNHPDFSNLSIRELVWESNLSGGAAVINFHGLVDIFIVQQMFGEKPFKLYFKSRLLGQFSDNYGNLDEAKEAAQTLFEQSVADIFFEAQPVLST